MKYQVATLTLVGDEGYPCYDNIEEVEATSENQAIFFYEKRHNITYRESHLGYGRQRQGAIYKPEHDYFRR
jgi:hypothetical protein